MRGPLAPLERAPVSVRAPFVSFPDDRYRYEPAAQRRAALVTALEGVELGAYDEYLLEWLAGWDVGVVAAVVSLLLRLREAATHQAPHHRGGGEPR
ncbi:MAG: hypothetical protein ACRDQ4_25655 [Pseudonocardiaceae bacterium]